MTTSSDPAGTAAADAQPCVQALLGHVLTLVGAHDLVHRIERILAR
jgi:hypothetical protein